MNQSQLNPMEILRSLGVEDVQAVAPVHGGYDTAMWRVEAKGKAYALRVFRPEQQGVSALESVAMEAAAAAGIAVPRVHATGDWGGRPVMLISWCPGRPMLEEALRQPWRMGSIAASFGRMQARLHGVTAPAALRGQRGDWQDWAGGSGDVALQARLRALPQRRDVLIHLDYHPLNVLTDGTRVTAVIDWSNAHAGDPRADVARTMTLLRLAPANRGLQRILSAPIRRVLAAGWLRGYTQVAGPLGDMAPFYTWAAAAMQADMAAKIGRPGIELTHKDLEPIGRWVARWRQRIRPPL